METPEVKTESEPTVEPQPVVKRPYTYFISYRWDTFVASCIVDIDKPIVAWGDIQNVQLIISDHIRVETYKIVIENIVLLRDDSGNGEKVFWFPIPPFNYFVSFTCGETKGYRVETMDHAIRDLADVRELAAKVAMHLPTPEDGIAIQNFFLIDCAGYDMPQKSEVENGAG